MNKIILIILYFVIFINLSAQEVKNCLMINTTSIKNSICSDTKWSYEEVKDYKEYEQKRNQFKEDNKTNSYAGIGGGFVKSNECAIVYEYKGKRSGFDCKPTLQAVIIGANIEYCEEELRKIVEKNHNSYETKPNVILRWCGKDLSTPKGKIITAEYDGVSGKFTLVKKTTGGEFFVAQLTNNTRDKLATIIIVTDTGEIEEEELTPGSTLTKKYEIKKVEIMVLYRNISEPKPIFDIITWMKENAHEILEIINGELIQRKWNPTCMCVRG